jgi:hypothetical protein
MYTSTPSYVFMACYFVKQGDDFNFILRFLFAIKIPICSYSNFRDRSWSSPLKFQYAIIRISEIGHEVSCGDKCSSFSRGTGNMIVASTRWWIVASRYEIFFIIPLKSFSVQVTFAHFFSHIINQNRISVERPGPSPRGLHKTEIESIHFIGRVVSLKKRKVSLYF